MHPFNVEQLILPSFSIFLFGSMIIYAYSKKPVLALSVSFIKSLIFFIYFCFCFDGTFTFFDDITYLDDAELLSSNNFSVLSLFKNQNELISLFASRHILYQVFNFLSFELFGAFYFAPVALNIIITFITSYVLFKILLVIINSKKKSIFIAVFFLLHWEVLSWSSIVNFKDILIQLITLSIVYGIVLYEKSKKLLIPLILIVISIVLLSMLRFYLIPLILFSYIVYKLLKIPKMFTSSSKTIIYVLTFLLFLILVVGMYYSNLQDFTLFTSLFGNPAIGILKFSLSPIPFQIDYNYQFIYFASLLHWLTFPLLIYGVYLSYKYNSNDVATLIHTQNI